MLSVRFWLLPISILLAQSAAAYPHFIGYGYQSCSNCHYNPMGNGPLTDYGRALAASTIAARPFFLPGAKDEELAERSGFLGKRQISDFIRPSVSYRGLLLESGIGSSASSLRYITMMLDANVVVKNRKGNLYSSITLGYLPGSPNTDAGLISREYYLGYRPSKNIGLYAGLMDVAFGIRVPDHTAYSRSMTLLAQNDQSAGLLLHWNRKMWEGAVEAFMGNPSQNPDLRLVGASSTAEYTLSQTRVVGGSIYYAKNEYRRRTMFELHTRLGSGQGSALLAELGFIREQNLTSTQDWGNYIFLQELYLLKRGLNLLMTGQYFTRTTFGPDQRNFQLGPGLQYFPMQRLELRTDFVLMHSLGGVASIPDLYNWLFQMHVWL